MSMQVLQEKVDESEWVGETYWLKEGKTEAEYWGAFN
jgi:hypothetical protein